MIKKYTEFLNESTLEFLLEANIQIEPEFLDVLSKIKSPLANELVNLNHTEVDVNQNYITFDINKDDKVLFRPDDKVEKSNFVFRNMGYSGYLQSIAMQIADNLEMEGQCIYANNGQRVKVKEIDQDKLADLVEKTNHWNRNIIIDLLKDKSEIVIISWQIGDRKYYTLAERKYLDKDISSVKQSEVAVGRFVRALLKKAGVKFTDKEIEEFVNEFKTTMRVKKDAFKNFEIVKENDIKFWYNEENYESMKGTMGSSCMRYKKCEDYLDIYCKNPKEVSLIILKSTTTENKICGRALLWVDIQGRQFMDRIYVNDSSHESLFIEFAISNGFYYKLNQNFHTGEPIVYNRVTLDDVDSVIEVALSSSNFYKYPYMDTMKYYNEGTNTLSSSDDSNYDYCLEDTSGGNGSCDCCGGSGECECSYCEGSGEVSCWNCQGDGKMQCDDCDGEGHFDCERCDGAGEIVDEDDNKTDCPDCKGEGTHDCERCDGDGAVRCSSCDGDGTNECDECRNGTRDCPECS